MNSATAGLLGAIIGASAGLLGNVIASHFQLELEIEKAQLVQSGEIADELRAEFAATARELLSLQHSIEWVCWFATVDDDLPDEKTISQYHKEVHETIPKLLGALASVSSLDQSIYDDLAPLADQLFRLDGQVATALVRHRNSPVTRSAILKDHFGEAVKLYKQLPQQLGEIRKRVTMRKKGN